MKVILKKLLSSNIDKKIIIHTNTATKSESIKEELDSWLNLTSAFEGNTIMIKGDMLPDLLQTQLSHMKASTTTHSIHEH